MKLHRKNRLHQKMGLSSQKIAPIEVFEAIILQMMKRRKRRLQQEEKQSSNEGNMAKKLEQVKISSRKKTSACSACASWALQVGVHEGASLAKMFLKKSQKIKKNKISGVCVQSFGVCLSNFSVFTMTSLVMRANEVSR